MFTASDAQHDLFRRVGNTPMLRIKVSSLPRIELLVKRENANPVMSHKDRIAAHAMRCLLPVASRGDTVVDASSGSYARSLAYFGNACGFRTVVFHVSRNHFDSSPIAAEWAQEQNCTIMPSASQESACRDARAYAVRHRNCWYVGQFDLLDSRRVMATTLGREIAMEVASVTAIVGTLGSGALLCGTLDVYPSARGYCPVPADSLTSLSEKLNARATPVVVEHSHINAALDFCVLHHINAGPVTLAHVAAALHVSNQFRSEGRESTILTFATDRYMASDHSEVLQR